MENVITDEEKIYLRRVCNYIRSLGLDDGMIIIELEGESLDSINWDYVTHFDNKYGAEIPEGLRVILEKILNSIDEDSIDMSSVENIDYDRVEIIIFAKERELLINHEYGYTESDEGDSIYWDSEENPEELKELFESLDPFFKDTRFLRINYNGSGDSGYLEGHFDGLNIETPNLVEEWCYSKLESNYGGWEINEGSMGHFEFEKDGEINKVTLVHYWFESKYEQTTLLELKL